MTRLSGTPTPTPRRTSRCGSSRPRRWSIYSPRVTIRRYREVHGSDEGMIWATVVVDGAQGKRSKATSIAPNNRSTAVAGTAALRPPNKHATIAPHLRHHRPPVLPSLEFPEASTWVRALGDGHTIDTAPRSVTWTAHHLTCSVVDSTTHHDARRRFALYYAGIRTSKPARGRTSSERPEPTSPAPGAAPRLAGRRQHHTR